MRSVPTALFLVPVCLSLVAVGVALSKNSTEGTPPATPSTSNLESRIARLEGEVEGLLAAKDSDFGESKGERPSVNDQSTLKSRLDALEALVSPLAASSGRAPGEVFSAEEIERTRRALTEVRRDEMGQMISRWIDKERAKSERLLTAVDEKMNLPWHEQKRVHEIMTVEADSHAQILEAMWSVEPPANRTEEEAIAAEWDLATIRMKEIRHKRDEQLQGLLGKERFDELLDVLRAASRPPPSEKIP